MAKFLKQVNTSLKLYLPIYYSILLQKRNTERMSLCDLDPPFFAKKSIFRSCGSLVTIIA